MNQSSPSSFFFFFFFGGGVSGEASFQKPNHWLNLQTMILQLIMCHTIKIRTNISCNQIKVRESARYQGNTWWASYLFTYLRDIDPTQLSQSRKYNTEHFPNMSFILYGRNYSNISFYIAITNMEIHISRSFFIF